MVPQNNKIDQQLHDQKQAYDNMPKVSSSKKIMEHIETKTSKRKRKGRWLRTILPYTAGVAALFLVTALIFSQFQMKSGWEALSSKEDRATPKNEDSSYSNTDTGSSTNQKATPEAGDRQMKIQKEAPFSSDHVPKKITDIRKKMEEMDEGEASQKEIDQWFLQVLKSRQDLIDQKQSKLNQLTYDAKDVNDVLKHPKALKNEKLKTFAEKMKQRGLSFDKREGMLALNIPYAKYDDWFDSFLSAKITAYLDLKTNQVVLRDAGFAGTWHTLGENLVQMEKFLKKWSDFVLAEQVKENYMKTFQYYFFGMENRSVSKPETTMVKDKVKASYEHVVDTYPKTSTGHVVQSFYKALKKNNLRVISKRAFFMPPLPEDLVVSYTRSAQDLFTLSDALADTYQKRQSTSNRRKNGPLNSRLKPEDLLSLYFHAVLQGEPDTQYSFYMDGVHDLPARKVYKEKAHSDIETWVQKMKDKLVKVQFLLEGSDAYAKLYISGEMQPRRVRLMKNSKNEWKMVWNPAKKDA